MDWIPALLKHLGVSRSVVGAVASTSAILYVGPRVFPAYVDPIPKEWSPIVLGVFAFSASFLVFWFFASAWGAVKGRWTHASAIRASYELNKMEIDVLHAMGEMPSEPLNLDRVQYEKLSLSRLEVLELMHGLSQKGLVSFNQFNADLVSLTAVGRQRALEIERASKRAAT